MIDSDLANLYQVETGALIYFKMAVDYVPRQK
jgi:hypothetical protein